jgi:hypothetical protein
MFHDSPTNGEELKLTTVNLKDRKCKLSGPNFPLLVNFGPPYDNVRTKEAPAIVGVPEAQVDRSARKGKIQGFVIDRYHELTERFWPCERETTLSHPERF